MGILDSVERGLERAVNGAFARTFRSGVQPVEIASALKRELDIGAVIVDRDRVLAPNRFVARVSPKDAARLQSLGATLENELRSVVTKHASRQNYQLLGQPDVEIRADESLTTGVLEIDATRVEGAVDWVAVIEVDGQRHELPRGTTTVGRGSDCGIRITDNAASRKHLELIWDGAAGLARDLGSTNGSKINGQRFREAALAPGIAITIGQTALRFQLVPGRSARAAARPAAASAPAPAASARPARPAPQAHQTPQARPAQWAPPLDPPSAAAPRSASVARATSRAANPIAAAPLPAAPEPTPDPKPATPRPRTSPAPSRDSATPDDTPGIDQDFWRGL